MIELFHKVRHVDVVRKSCVSVSGWSTPRACSRPLVTELINFTIYGGYLDTLLTKKLVRHLD